MAKSMHSAGKSFILRDSSLSMSMVNEFDKKQNAIVFEETL